MAKLKTDYKYVYFIHMGEELKKPAYACYADDDIGGNPLGTVKWYKNWRQYCFFPDEFTFFNAECLENIKHFINQL